MAKSFGILLLLLGLLPIANATSYFDYSTTAKSAYRLLFDLRFEEARHQIQLLKQGEPENLIVHHLENYLDFLTLYIDEEQAQLDRLASNKNIRLALVEKGDKSSPYYLFVQADIILHWAIVHLKFQNYFKASFEINRAFKLLETNARKFPNFMPNKKNLGFLHAVVSTMPARGILEWVTNLEGNYDKGLRELREVIQYSKEQDFLFENETYILLAYILLTFGKDETAAWQTINESKLNEQQSLSAAFVKASLAMESKRNDVAISILKNRPTGSYLKSFPYLDFLLGKAKLQRLDSDADDYLLQFLANYKGKNHVKDAYRRLAWHEWIQDNPAGYAQYMKMLQNKGATILSEDKSALQEAEEDILPNKGILKARVLLDGGYANRAYKFLILESNETFNILKNKIEYAYFLGRTTHQLERYEEAIRYYQWAIQMGKREPWYYACRAALEKGNIYLTTRNKEKAKAAFEECLAIYPNEHRFSLHQQAKARLGKI